MMTPQARTIPADLRRKVRQECYFGCVICGMPIFHYDHIRDFAEVQRHEAANLALLCPNHHQEKTSKRLGPDAVTRARLSPFNASRAMTATHTLMSEIGIEAWVGSNVSYDTKTSAEFHVIWINGDGYFTIHHEDNGCTHSIRLTDRSGNLALLVQEGNLTVSTDVWDYRYEGTKLIIKGSKENIILDADISDRAVRINEGSFVDQYETGVLVRKSGEVVFTMSGLEIGTVAEGSIGAHPSGAFAVVRESCFNASEVPAGFAMRRAWAAEYETKADALRIQKAEGLPGPSPVGLEDFRPFPRL